MVRCVSTPTGNMSETFKIFLFFMQYQYVQSQDSDEDEQMMYRVAIMKPHH